MDNSPLALGVTLPHHILFQRKMANFMPIFLFFALVALTLTLTSTLASHPIILSKLITTGNIKQAREAARVRNYSSAFGISTGEEDPVESYSGFLTVDEICHAQIFFWFFPAEKNAATAPLILWHGGGPGSSGLGALFNEHGPFALQIDGSVTLRSMPWTLERSVLYVDSPVGTGFSFTDDRDACKVKSTSKTGSHMLQALLQFFQLFPQYQPNPFFIFSGSYGGKFVPAIAYEIHHHNRKDCDWDDTYPKVNFKGFVLASGFTDPISQIDYGDFYLSYGLIGSAQRDYFRERESLAKANINQGNWTAAFNIIEPLIIGMDGIASHLKATTGIYFPYNMLSNANGMPPELRRHVAFLNRPEIQALIHVGRTNYSNSSPKVYKSFREDVYQSVKPMVEELLDSGLYKMLFISNQLDLVVPHTSISNFLNSLGWKGEGEYRGVTAEKWEHEGVVKGYLRSVRDKRLSYLFLRNSGHLWIYDVPQIAYQVMTRFTDNKGQF